MMTGTIRLFEKTTDGLLVEVAPEQAIHRRATGTISRVSLEIDVLWTAEEEAARNAEEQAVQEAERSKDAERRARRAAVLAKLQALGLTADELKDALAGSASV